MLDSAWRVRYTTWVAHVFHALERATASVYGGVGLAAVAHEIGVDELTWDDFATRAGFPRALMTAMEDLEAIGLVDLYMEMLCDVGRRADDIGERQIACHWPFVGSQFNGTLIVGQALDGWDADETTARWPVGLAQTDGGRRQILDGTRAWASARPEPMDEVLRWGHRRGSPFWNLSLRVMRRLEPDAQSWSSRHAWWNVYPIGFDRPKGSPYGPLKDAQAPHVGSMFWEVADLLQVRRVVILAGMDWWPAVRDRLGLQALARRSMPLIASGQLRRVNIVATYHPGADNAAPDVQIYAPATIEAAQTVLGACLVEPQRLSDLLDAARATGDEDVSELVFLTAFWSFAPEDADDDATSDLLMGGLAAIDDGTRLGEEDFGGARPATASANPALAILAG